ncbi:MAG: YdcF family protein, partial [Pseudomonadota bacterium]
DHRMGVILRLALVFLGAGILALSATLAYVIWAGQAMEARHAEGRSLTKPVEVTIVLGAGMDPDGVLAFSSRRRVWAGVELLKAGKTQRLLFSGGLALPGVPSAGEMMRDQAIANGADPAVLTVEGRSISTFQNLLFSYPMLTEETSVALLTDSFHLSRASTLSWFFGRSDVPLVAARGLEAEHWAPRYWLYVREALAWWLNLVKMAAWWGGETIGLSLEQRTALIR